MSNPSGTAGRIEVVDALRALALAGILQVNIQSFVWGSGDPLGEFLTIPSATDIAMHVLVGTFVSTKFMSLFAFLFGLGAALQYRSIRRALPAELDRFDKAAAAKAVYRRRLRFLLVVGLLHGTLLYFGDILAFYAACGFLMVLYLPWRVTRVARATVAWWLLATAILVLAVVAIEVGRDDTLADADVTAPLATMQAFIAYTEADFLTQLPRRLEDFAGLLSTSLLLATPQVVGLFLLGVLAGRLGWLARPERHAAVWQVATWLGLAALPFAAYGEWLNYEARRYSPGLFSGVSYLLQFFGSALACLYVAALVRLRKAPPVAKLIHWIAPAGRMPLTNYLAQSVLMGVLLSGWGFGLGAALNRTELALLAAVIVGVQWVASRWWIARFGKGPMEDWWARATYRSPGRSQV